MPTKFETLSDGFYTAFFEPDPEKRAAAIESWIKTATSTIQSVTEKDIRAFLEPILKDSSTPEAWQSRVEKFSRLYSKSQSIDTYKLFLEDKLRKLDPQYSQRPDEPE